MTKCKSTFRFINVTASGCQAIENAKKRFTWTQFANLNIVNITTVDFPQLLPICDWCVDIFYFRLFFSVAVSNTTVWFLGKHLIFHTLFNSILLIFKFFDCRREGCLSTVTPQLEAWKRRHNWKLFAVK